MRILHNINTHKSQIPQKTLFNAPNFAFNTISGTKYHTNKNKPLERK